jgi:hypothetical protein
MIFPDIVHLYCVFHLDKALREMLRKLKSPPGMPPESFSKLRGYLFREVKLLVCGHKNTDEIMGEDEFDIRAGYVSQLLWAIGASTEGHRWDEYVKVKARWAPYARWATVNRVFGEGTKSKLPMLIVSNNVCESFFNILKHVLLGGLPCKTLFGFLQLWDTYQSQLIINCLKVNINVRQLLGRELPVAPTSVVLPAAVRAFAPAATQMQAVLFTVANDAEVVCYLCIISVYNYMNVCICISLYIICVVHSSICLVYLARR